MPEATPIDVQVISVDCQGCGRATRHSIVTRYDDQHVIHTLIRSRTYLIAKCLGCDIVSMIEETWFPRESNGGGDDWNSALSRYIFPPRSTSQRILSGEWHLPHNLQVVLRETRLAICASQHVLAALGLRTLIEGACREKGIRKGNLEKKIDQLADKGHLAKLAAATLHRIRFLGNDAAHELDQPKKEEIEAAARIVLNLLEGAFIIPEIEKSVRTRPPPPNEGDDEGEG